MDIIEFKQICECIEFYKPRTNIRPHKEIHEFKLEIKETTTRGIYLEEALLIEINKFNKNKAFYKTEGRFSAQNESVRIKCEVTPTRYKQNLKVHSHAPFVHEYMLINGMYCSPEKTTYYNVPFIENKFLKAKVRCLSKFSVDYCFVDLIIDNTLIDIKTDLNTKYLLRYFRQAFMQSVLFSSFVKTNKSFEPYFTDNEIQTFELPIDSIAIYFWRSNEYFTIPLDELLQVEKYNRLVEIYSRHFLSHGKYLRGLLKRQ